MGRSALLFLGLAACTVDGSVIDDLPCECADGYVCDVATDRCVLDGQPDGGGFDAETDGAIDAGTDAAGRDPDLGDCLLAVQDDFASPPINREIWGITTDNEAQAFIDNGEFVGQVPANSPSDYAFLFAEDRIDLSNCTAVVELVATDLDDFTATFFQMRISNRMGSLGIAVSDGGSIRAWFDRGEEERSEDVWSTVYSETEHRWLGLRGDAGEVAWLISADGVQWTEVFRRAAPIDLSDLQPLFGIGTDGDNATAVEARFDNYNVLP